jgi:molybdopterin synthase sulfur carrier subunit
MTDATLFDTDAAHAAHSGAAVVRLRLVYLARLREALGRDGETLNLAAAAPRRGDLIDHLRSRGGAFADELAPGRSFRAAVNHAMAGADAVLADGDEVALFPPVTGG